MSDSKPAPPAQPWLQLAHPFASLLAVALGIVFLKFFFNIEIKKINLDFVGVNAELVQAVKDTQDSVISAGSTAGRELADLKQRLELLESKLTARAEGPLLPTPSSPPAPRVVRDVDTTAQSTAAELAPLFQKLPNRSSALFNREGYVFIGNVRDATIDAPNLRANGETVRRVADLKVGSTYTTAAHLTLRESYPGDNKADYYLGVPSLGVVTSGLSVILLDAPRAEKRPSGLVQLWAKVRVAE